MNMRILVIDDEEMSLLAMAKVLQDNHHEVTTSLDGVKALKIVNDGKFDLIISDILMPCISGFTLLSMLKNFYFSKVPLMLMSVYGGKRIADKSHSLGARAFISKPINYAELFKKIEKLN
jgi:two-component system sensor histidine kinase ChiS